MEYNAENICRTVISSEEQNLNKQLAEFRISILFQYFMNTLATFNTFSRSWKPIQYFFNTFNTAWEPCRRNPWQPLAVLRFRGTPVEKHCSSISVHFDTPHATLKYISEIVRI